jgi:hypothetical protein
MSLNDESLRHIIMTYNRPAASSQNPTACACADQISFSLRFLFAP